MSSTAKIVAIVGARLNSSRLPGKQLLDLAGQPVIARIFERLARVPAIDKVVLATTADDYNRPLVRWAECHHQPVFAFAGDVNDLVGRVDAVVQVEQPTMVIYVCGDSPLIEPDTLAAWIQAHEDHPEADWVELAPPGEGAKYIHEGFTVYRRPLWDRIVAESRSADDKEHVGSVMKRLRHDLTIGHFVDLPIFSAMEHRISVDTPSDYRFMSEIYRRWYADHPADSIVSLAWVITELQCDHRLADINRNVRQKAVGEHSIPLLIVCQAGPGIGLGHLARCLALAEALQDRHFAGIRLLIQGPATDKTGLALLPHRFLPMAEDLVQALRDEQARQPFRALILDLHPGHLPNTLGDLLRNLGEQGIRRIGIDALRRWAGPGACLDLLCLPGFHVPADTLAHCTPTPVRQGWPYYLITPPRQAHRRSAQPRLLVLTGGSDESRLGVTLPAALDRTLPAGLHIDWVQGPFAQAPVLPEQPRHDWLVHQAPESLDSLMARADYALTVYGVALFELLSHGVAAVVFSPYGNRDQEELPALADADVAVVAADAHAAVSALARLIADPDTRQRLSETGPRQVDGQGPVRLARDIFDLLEPRS